MQRYMIETGKNLDLTPYWNLRIESWNLAVILFDGDDMT